jgi:hypothetical protein
MRRGDWYQTDKIVQKVCVHFTYQWAACVMRLVSCRATQDVFRPLRSRISTQKGR